MQLPSEKIGDPQLNIELPGGEIRTFSLWEISGQLDVAVSSGLPLPSRCEMIREAFGFPRASESDSTLTQHQCVVLCAEVFCRRADISKARTGMAQYAELLHFYPSLNLADLGIKTPLDPEDLLLLQHQMQRIQAVERLERIADMASAFGGGDGAVANQLALVDIAYRDDERNRSIAIVTLQRSR